MNLDRRQFMVGVGSLGVLGIGGYLWFSGEYAFRNGGQIRTERPVVENVTAENTGDSYGVLVGSPGATDRIKWEYVASEDPVFAEEFSGIPFDTHFLAVSGLRLPPGQKIATTETSFTDGKMRQTHVVRPARQPTDKPLVHTLFEKWELNGRSPPDTVTISTEYRDDPVGE